MDNSQEKNINRNEPDLTLDNENKTEAVVESKEFEFLGDPNAVPEISKKDKPKKSILKRLMPIIALFGVAVVLFVSVMVLKKVVPDNKQDITKEEKKTGIELIDESGASGEKLEIKNQLDEFSFIRRLEKTYYIEGKENLKVSMSKIISAMTYAGTVTAETEVKKGVTDWEEYGLKDPVATVRWTKGDKTHYFEIGDLAPSGNYYMRFNGGDTVYTYSTDAASMFVTARMDYYDTTLFAYDSKTDGPYITEFCIGQRDGENLVVKLLDLTNEDLNNAFLITTPIEHYFANDKQEDIYNLIGALTSLTVFSDDVSPENLKKYGLDNPKYTFSFTNVAVKNVAHFGNTSDDGYVYVYAEGHDFIYIIDEATINILIHDIATYCDTMSYSRSYDTIDKLTIQGGGKTYDIDIVGTAEDGDLKAYINDKYVEYENFGTLYAHIISINVTKVGQKPQGAAPLVTITVYCHDGTTDVIKYYKVDEMESFYELDGAGKLLVPTAKVEQILKFAQNLYDGKEIVIEW